MEAISKTEAKRRIIQAGGARMVSFESWFGEEHGFVRMRVADQLACWRKIDRPTVKGLVMYGGSHLDITVPNVQTHADGEWVRVTWLMEDGTPMSRATYSLVKEA